MRPKTLSSGHRDTEGGLSAEDNKGSDWWIQLQVYKLQVYEVLRFTRFLAKEINSKAG